MFNNCLFASGPTYPNISQTKFDNIIIRRELTFDKYLRNLSRLTDLISKLDAIDLFD